MVLILRVGPPYGLFAPYSAMPEFESLSALAGRRRSRAAGLSGLSDDPAILGAPFFLSEKVEGDTPLPWGSQGQALEGARRDSLAAGFHWRALAALHRFDWRATPLAKWGERVTARQRRPPADRRLGGALPAMDAAPPSHGASRSCVAARQLAPAARRLSMVHGDYRLGNFLERDGRISAILDWEVLVHLGDPVEDLGWSLPAAISGRHARSSVGLLAKRIFLARYEAQSGLSVDRASLRFYLVFSLLKLAFNPYGGGALLRGRTVQRPPDARHGDADRAGLPADRPDPGAGGMNNSLGRLIDGVLVATLRKEVIPRVEGDYARGQAFGVVYMLNSLKLRASWSNAFLLDQLSARSKTQAASLKALAPDLPGAPLLDVHAPPPTPCRTQMPSKRCGTRATRACAILIDWLGANRARLPEQAVARAETAIDTYLARQAKYEISTSARPMFVEMSRRSREDVSGIYQC